MNEEQDIVVRVSRGIFLAHNYKEAAIVIAVDESEVRSLLGPGVWYTERIGEANPDKELASGVLSRNIM